MPTSRVASIAALIAAVWVGQLTTRPIAPSRYSQGPRVERGLQFHHADDLGLCACYAPGTPQEYVERFEAEMFRRHGDAYSVGGGRWSSTASDGSTGSTGTPITLTYSFVPDFSTGDPATSNVLHATLDGQFGSRAAWKSLFAAIFAEWSAVAGVSFVEVSDDGATWPSSPGVTGVRGDVRIVCLAIDGTDGVLAYNYYPNTGDMSLDSAEDWADATNDYRFVRNVIAHEMGHGLGLEHVLPRNGTKLMEAYLSTGFLGPQDDDVRGGNRNYGDPHEPNGSSGAAASLGTQSGDSTYAGMSLNNASDVDWFALSLSAAGTISVSAAPVGSSYMVSPDPGSPASINTAAINRLRVEVYDSAGTALLASGSAASLGQTAASGSTTAAGTSFRIKLFTSDSTDDVQRYGLTVTSDPAGSLSVQSSAATGVSIAVSPADRNGASDGVTNFSRVYDPGQSVQLTAPSTKDYFVFENWTVSGAAQPAGQTSINVTAGSAGTTCVAVYSDPNAMTVEAGGAGTIAAGEAASLSVVVSGGTAPYEYAWSPGETLSDATVASPAAEPYVTTTYTVVVTDAAGRVGSDTVTIDVIPALVVEAGTNFVIKAGQRFILEGGAAGGSPPYAYQWDPAAALESPTSAVTYGTVSATTVFVLTVTDSDGRSAYDSVVISVVSPLAINAGADVTIEAGAAASLTASASGGQAPYSYQWSPTVVPAELGYRVVRATPSETTTYTLVARDASGQQASDSVTVTVVPSATASTDGNATDENGSTDDGGGDGFSDEDGGTTAAPLAAPCGFGVVSAQTLLLAALTGWRGARSGRRPPALRPTPRVGAR